MSESLSVGPPDDTDGIGPPAFAVVLQACVLGIIGICCYEQPAHGTTWSHADLRERANGVSQTITVIDIVLRHWKLDT